MTGQLEKNMKEVKISKISRSNSRYVEAKYVCVIKSDISIDTVRDAVKKALAERWLHPEEMVQSISIPIELANHSPSVPIIIIIKTSYKDISEISAAFEEHDRAFLSAIVERLDGWYPKIIYKNK